MNDGDEVSRMTVEKACKLRNRDPNLVYLDFLFQSYEPEFWYWEVLECGRRLLLTSMNVF